MTDDWETPTGEYESPRRDAAERRNLRALPFDEVDDSPGLGVTGSELRLFDAFLTELAIEAAEDPRPPTAEEQLAIDDLGARFERLQAMTPEELEAERARLRRLGY